KQRLATGIGEAAYTRANNLSPCTVAQLRTMDPNNLDIFNLPCVPPGVDLRAEQTKLVQEISTSDEFLEDPVVTANDLSQENGHSVFDQTSAVPTAYSWL